MKKCMRRKLLSLLNVFTIVFTLVFASLAGTVNAKAVEDSTKELVSEIADAAQIDFVETDLVKNGDFESPIGDEWNVSDGTYGYTGADSWASVNKTNWFYTNNNSSDVVEFSLTQTIASVEAGRYKIVVENEGEQIASGLSLSVNGISKELTATTGWDSWTTTELAFELSQTGDITISLEGSLVAWYWGAVDNIVLYKEKSDEDISDDPVEEVDPVEADVTVERVAVDDDFITGADISSYLSIVNSGAKFYDQEGNALSNQGFFDLLAAGGTNYIRIRVWNNPYDENGNGYGGGNNDLETAKILGQYATNAGMKVLIDFHYSDFWADPGKQQAPKAWADMTAAQKATAVSEYTTESLKYLLDNGVDVGMVQVGNETTNKICGVDFGKNTADACAIFAAGCDAVHAVAKTYDREILAAIHFTNPERAGNYANYAKRLYANNVNYDVFASSYYPYWHGTTENLTSVLKNVADTYGVKVMVAETSWANTLADGDGHENTVRKGNNDSNQPYDFSVQGQCTEIREVANAVANVGEKGIGLFYWENAWIPVQYAYDENGNIDADKLNANKLAWEKYGSGWASSYAGEYDANDAGKWFGGSAVDNQAWFDFNGKALSTVNVYNYIRTGSISPAILESVVVDDITVELKDIETLELPTKATAKYSDGTSKEVAIELSQTEFEAAKETGIGEYVINGTADIDSTKADVQLKLTILPTNLIVNGGFENGLNDWIVSNNILNTSDAASNSKTGSGCLHFYSANAGAEATATQKVSLTPGYYTLEGYIQGGSAGETDEFTISLSTGDENFVSNKGELTSWQNWSQLTTGEFLIKEEADVTVTITISQLTAGVWGSFDDVRLYKSSDKKYPCEPGEKVIENFTVAGINVTGSYDEVVYCTDCGEEISRTKVEITAVDAVKLEANTYTADGKAHQPKVTVTNVNGEELIENTDYTVSYSGNGVKAGNYTVKVALTGNYEGETELSYTVKDAPAAVVVQKVASTVTTVVKTIAKILSKIFRFR